MSITNEAVTVAELFSFLPYPFFSWDMDDRCTCSSCWELELLIRKLFTREEALEQGLITAKLAQKMLVKWRRWGLLKLDRHFLCSQMFFLEKLEALQRLKYHQPLLLCEKIEPVEVNRVQHRPAHSLEVKQTWWPSFEPIIRLLTIVKLCQAVVLQRF